VEPELAVHVIQHLRAQVPAALKGLIFGPNDRPMSPSHTRRRGRIYRHYVAREAIADGYETCAVTSVPAADVEGAVLNHLQKLLAAPELIVGPGLRRSKVTTASPSARSRFCSPTSLRSGASYSPPSRRALSSCWLSGSMCRRTHLRCGSEPRGWRASSASSGRSSEEPHDAGRL